MGLGVTFTPIHVIIHESGHALAAKLLAEEKCNPYLTFEGPLLMSSYVSVDDCNLSLYSVTAVYFAGPLAEIIVATAMLYFSKSKYTPLVLLPQVTRMAIYSLGPLRGKRGDYTEIYDLAGFISYSISAAVSIVPLALSIFSLKSSFFNSESKIETVKHTVKISRVSRKQKNKRRK